MQLKDAVRAVNDWPGRASKKTLAVVVECRYCRSEFPVQVQDARLAVKKGWGHVCGAEACRAAQTSENNRRRKKVAKAKRR